MPQKFQVISSIISFTFNVVYLPSVFHIIPTKLLIRYIYDHPIHHKENKQAELTRGRVDSGAELVSGRVDPLPVDPAKLTQADLTRIRFKKGHLTGDSKRMTICPNETYSELSLYFTLL